MYSIELNRIYQRDCIEGMRLIPDKSIDAIICDPPYEKTRNKWDTLIPFDQLWEQYTRIIKDNGAIILFSQGIFTARLQLSNEKMFRYSLVWEKDRPSGFLNAKRMPLRSHEDINIFYKNTPTYNPQFWEGEPLHGMGKKFRKGNLANNNYGKFASHSNPSAEREGDTKKYPRSVLKFQKPHPPIHPTQKPVELCEWLVRTYTNEGDVILDNCMGSGTTAVAAAKAGRNFIGFELEEEYVKIANKRLEELQQAE